MHSIHHAQTLKLHPNPIGPGTRKNQIELNLSELNLQVPIRQKWMFMNQIDQIVARSKQVPRRS